MTDDHTLGDAAIEPAFATIMKVLASGIDKALNGDNQGEDRVNGFVLLCFPFDDADKFAPERRCNYMSNCQREGIINLFKAQLDAFEREANPEGTTTAERTELYKAVLQHLTFDAGGRLVLPPYPVQLRDQPGYLMHRSTEDGGIEFKWSPETQTGTA